jgi:hypothetical protein
MRMLVKKRNSPTSFDAPVALESYCHEPLRVGVHFAICVDGSAVLLPQIGVPFDLVKKKLFFLTKCVNKHVRRSDSPLAVGWKAHVWERCLQVEAALKSLRFEVLHIPVPPSDSGDSLPAGEHHVFCKIDPGLLKRPFRVACFPEADPTTSVCCLYLSTAFWLVPQRPA